MRRIDKIIIHCSASQDVSISTIRKWHTDPVDMQIVNGKRVNVGGRGWRDVGYHFVVRHNGFIELGRPITIPGAHVRGFNLESIGICLTGGRGGVINYSINQFLSLRLLIAGLESQHDQIKGCVMGHNQFTTAKTCPNFDVEHWYNFDEVRAA